MNPSFQRLRGNVEENKQHHAAGVIIQAGSGGLGEGGAAVAEDFNHGIERVVVLTVLFSHLTLFSHLLTATCSVRPSNSNGADFACKTLNFKRNTGTF